MWKIGLSTLFFSLSSAALSQELRFTLPDQKLVTVQSQPELKERKLSQLLLVWPKESPWVPVAFDAEMPEHRHGMNVKATAPVLLSGKEARYQIEGVKLHMPGLWILKLQVRGAAGEVKWVDQTYTLGR